MPGWECPSGANGKSRVKPGVQLCLVQNTHVANLFLFCSLCLCISCHGRHQSWLRCACGIGASFLCCILVLLPPHLQLHTDYRLKVSLVSGTAKPECKYPKQQQQDTNVIILKQDKFQPVIRKRPPVEIQCDFIPKSH